MELDGRSEAGHLGGRRGVRFASTNSQDLPDESLGLTSAYVWVPKDADRLATLAERVGSGPALWASARSCRSMPGGTRLEGRRGQLDGWLVLAYRRERDPAWGGEQLLTEYRSRSTEATKPPPRC